MPEARVIPLDGREPGPATRRRRKPQRCVAVDAAGVRCSATAIAEHRCGEHLEALERERAAAAAPEWERRLAGALAFVRRRVTGDYPVDDFGFDPDLTENVLLASVRPLYQKYFRVEARGLDNIPATGGALVVANHSGTIPLDALMTQLAIFDHHPAHRHLRMLGADLVFKSPIVAPVARKGGATLACKASPTSR